MAKRLEILQDGKFVPDPNVGPVPETYSEWAKRNIIRQAYNLGETLLASGQRGQKESELTLKALNPNSDKTKLVTERESFRPQPLLQQELQKKGIEPEYLQPKGGGEEYFDELATNLPIAAAVGGGPLLTRLGLSTLGTTAEFLTKKAGGSPLLQKTVGIGLPIAASAFAPSFKAPFSGKKPTRAQKTAPPELDLKQKNITKAVEQYQKKQYKIAEKIAEQESHIGDDLKEIINQEQKQAASVYSDPVNKAILEDTNDFLAHINEGKINVKDLWERKKFYNAQANKKIDPKLSDYYERMAGKAAAELQKFGQLKPEFGKPFRAGEESTIALKRAEEAVEYMKKHVNLEKWIKNPITTSILYGVSKYKEKVPGYFSLLYNSTEAQRFAGKAIAAIFDKNVPAFINNAKKLDDEIGNYLKKTKGKKQLQLVR